jgi:ElaB/YqjD/DUF883 family membrane-anchored ribosome-binding protein
MTFEELLREVDKLSDDELRVLRERIDPRLKDANAKIRALREALAELREGLSEEELAEIEWAMNVETGEAFDEDEWKA